MILLGPGLILAALPGPQADLPGPDRLVAIGGFLFRIARVAFDTTAMGFVPEDMGPKDRLMFVEFELLSGNRDDFMGLAITLDSGRGRRSKAAALISGGMMKALSALTIKSASSRYRPDSTNIAWAFVVREGDRDFFLTFPTGDVVSLGPGFSGPRPKRQGP